MHDHHWTEADRQLLAESTRLEVTAEIAITILQRMQVTGLEIVQICGPMTTGGLGSFELNMARFRLAIMRAQERGHHVFNQVHFQESIIRIIGFVEERPEEGHSDILEIFYRRIFESGLVARVLFLPGWQSSRGACWERAMAEKLGIEINEYPKAWLT